MPNVKIKKYWLFILLSYLSAFFWEEIPRTFFIHFLQHPTIKHLWEIKGAIPFFVIWYGSIFSIFYVFLRDKPLKLIVGVGILVGMIAETFLFKKMNMLSFFLFPLLYGGMFYCPFKFMRRINAK